MEFLIWLKATALGCADNLFQMIIIIIPLMIAIEFLKEFRLLEKFSPKLAPAMRVIGLPAEAVLPILAGLFLGIIYGAGLIIQSAKDGSLTHKQMTLVCSFLVICHSIVEDHALFGAQGAAAVLLVFLRLAFAILITFVLNKVLPEKKQAPTDKDFAVLNSLDTCGHQH